MCHYTGPHFICLFVLRFYKIEYVYLCLYWSVYVNARVHGGKRVLTPLELELQAVAGHLVWMLGTELRSSASSMYSYQLSDLSSSLSFYFLYQGFSLNLEAH